MFVHLVAARILWMMMKPVVADRFNHLTCNKRDIAVQMRSTSRAIFACKVFCDMMMIVA